MNSDAIRDLDAAVDRAADEAITLLRDLVAVRSVNPLAPGVEPGEYDGGERRVNELLKRRFDELNLTTTYVEAAEGRPNLVAVKKGAGGGASLALNGHVDTVAAAREEERPFADPWDAQLRDGVLYGLGAADMKAGHAAAWLVMTALVETGITLAGDLHVHSVVGEETMSHELGTSAVLDAGFTPDAALILEGTTTDSHPLQVSNAAAGNYLFHMTIRGKATHWSARGQAIHAGGDGDEVGVNAIDKAVYVYNAMRQLEQQWAFSKKHPAFAPGTFIIHPGALRADIGMPAPAFFPDRARFDCLLSFPPGEQSDAIATEVESHIAAAANLDPWLREHPVAFEWEDTWPPAYTDPDSEFCRTVMASRDALGCQYEHLGRPSAPMTMAGQTDASFYQARGVPALVCGPGDLRYAHSPHEQVNPAHVISTAKMALRTAVEWCGLG